MDYSDKSQILQIKIGQEWIDEIFLNTDPDSASCHESLRQTSVLFILYFLSNERTEGNAFIHNYTKRKKDFEIKCKLSQQQFADTIDQMIDIYAEYFPSTDILKVGYDYFLDADKRKDLVTIAYDMNPENPKTLMQHIREAWNINPNKKTRLGPPPYPRF